MRRIFIAILAMMVSLVMAGVLYAGPWDTGSPLKKRSDGGYGLDTDKDGTDDIVFGSDGSVTVGGTLSAKTPNYDPADSGGELTITEAQAKGGWVTDGDLTAATDAQLPDLQYYVGFSVYIENGTYAISLVAPSGEKMRMDGTLLDANDEIDLSDDEGDLFILRRVYSDSETEWVWNVYPITGTVTDGGAAD